MQQSDEKAGGASKHAKKLMPFQKRKQLERDIEHITAEMYRRNKELAETNRTLSLLRTIDAIVLESHTSLERVCQHIVDAITQATGGPLVALFTRGGRSNDELQLRGLNGGLWSNSGVTPDLGIENRIHIATSHEWFSSFASTRLVSLENLQVEAISNLLDISTIKANTLLTKVPVKTLYVVKLLSRRQIVGLLVMGYLESIDKIEPSQSVFVDHLSESLGVALDNKLLFEENQFVLKKLQESNEKLKALDETKDDFISMASHQLRTPLTSVKGYLSMVLEEDAGKITPMQKEMLGQAFFSSQRMVYLIADLLNVSRLKTGKFIIEPTEVNLAKIVKEELSQLQETAAGRHLTLEYEQPDNFPELMLDETKTRQVIMNFVDNAIYYTPAGGKITVRLIDKPSTIELRVEDDGIGVPKSEQKHLFTKFYRAGNARKARPDGTGLGLFMAKKVVVAQGGSILFESQEGKGSMFGFVFSKSRLTPAAQPTPTPELNAQK